MKTNGKRRLSRLLLLLLALALIGGGVYWNRVADYRRAVAAITVTEPDLSTLPDGTYVGDCDVGFIYAKVAVTVRGGAIAAVDLLEHRNGRGAAAETIPAAVTAAQRVDVDAVSGATNSSTVIKKAIERALTGPGN